MLKFLFSIVTSLFIGNIIYSQDIHFSQYQQAPLLLNPALTGNSKGDWRAGFNFREQWTRTAIPFNTYNFFFDKKVYIYSRVFMAGGYLVLDQLNPDGLTKISAIPSLAYRVDYGKNIFIAGLQPGIGFYNLEKVLTHPDQFNYVTGTFDTNLPTNDVTGRYSRLFADINFGILWSRPIAGLHPNVGLAMYHINRPKNSLYSYDTKTRMPVKTLMNFDVPIPVSPLASISPSILMIRQRKSQEVNLGTDCILNSKASTTKIDDIFFGIHYRNSRAEGLHSLVFIGGVKYKGFSVGVSYDEYFNADHYSSSVGTSFELSLIYTGINSITDKFSLPCDVY